MLGYRNTSFNKRVWRKFYKKNRIVKVLQYTAKFDSTDDLPWLKEDMIPVLDRVFPGSKFVYLMRDEDSWLTSLKNWNEKVRGGKLDMDGALEKFRAHREFVMNTSWISRIKSFICRSKTLKDLKSWQNS